MSRVDDFSHRFGVYRKLMRHRIQNILLVSSLYEAYVLEEDDTLEEQLWYQYTHNRLSSVPQIHKATSCETALEMIATQDIDLILTMAQFSGDCTNSLIGRARELKPGMPVARLVTDPSQVGGDAPDSDQVFLWQNNPALLLALVKLYEDLANVDEDVRVGKVRVILLVEDSPAYYSAFLPTIYKVLMDLARTLVADGLNSQHKQLRVRSRPKILLARSWEEAVTLYSRYRDYVLGVISDVSFPRHGKLDPEAGFKLMRLFRDRDPVLPICLQSADAEDNRNRAQTEGAYFIDKNSDRLLKDLRTFLALYMGFGPFIFRDDSGRELARANNAYEMLDRVQSIPGHSIAFHAKRNDFSHWMMARGELVISEILFGKTFDPERGPEESRKFILDVVQRVLREKQSDVITQFAPEKLPYDVSFMRLGTGSMGGKARGVAFLRYMIGHLGFASRYPGIQIVVPPTLVLCAGEFDLFLEENNLREVALDGALPYPELEQRFAEGDMREELVQSLAEYLWHNHGPLAVRSSSILEDSQHLPLAGLYATVMLANTGSWDKRLSDLILAVKQVWASTYGQNPRAYFHQTSYRIEEEHMSVVLQHLAGRRRGDHFYPAFSGVAQSHNFYPVSYMRPEDGVVQVAAGLGRMVVEGGKSVRFSPRFPKLLPQFATTEDWLRNAQHGLFALRLTGTPNPEAVTEELELLSLDEALPHGILKPISAILNENTGMFSNSILAKGTRVVNFGGVLNQGEVLPLATILGEMLPEMEAAMDAPIELEFSVDYGPKGVDPVLYLLQLRPMISEKRWAEVPISDDMRARSWCCSRLTQGNGVYKGLRDIVYVKREAFDKGRTKEIAQQIGQMNKALVGQKRNYILVGFGRWGSSDPWMGIGVAWHQISGVQVLIEVGLEDFDVEPSQGSHFFQNITSLNIGCISVPWGGKQGCFDWELMEALPKRHETEFLVHVRLREDVTVYIDGQNREAVVVHRPSELDDSGEGPPEPSLEQ
ncbi:MAG: hypothetical protein JXX28_07975 [Deltaproteobacteria bacterium]|nr:hypothetical protein [Deltaproteobacteria bacterium]